jgi:hypothetical protein
MEANKHKKYLISLTFNDESCLKIDANSYKFLKEDDGSFRGIKIENESYYNHCLKTIEIESKYINITMKEKLK